VVKLRPRLIPSVILAATVLLGLKVSDIFSVGGHALAQGPSTSQATGTPLDLTSQANAAKTPSPTPAAGQPQDTSAAKPTAPTAPPQQQSAAPQPAAPKQAAPQQQAAAPQQQASAPQAAAPPAEAAKAAPPAEAAKPGPQTAEATAAGAPGAATPAAKPAMKDPLLLSPAEIEILQELSARRTQLDKRAADVDQQQVVLRAAEKRIDEKIAKLQDLQKSIQASVDKQNAVDDARTQSLVKIYETMKPPDAAQILSQLDMPILLQMLSHMKEAKTAPILAAMDPAKAEAITTAMAKRQNPPSVPAQTAAAKP
jgi:flagellar motility protein MotE (MotC chaperone)